MHRYTYQGTKYDLGASGNMAAGPFGSPDRYKAGLGEQEVGGNWERPIGLYRTSDTYVVQSRTTSSTVGSVLWYGPASAIATVFTPFLVAVSDVPASFRSSHQAVFSRSSAFWAVSFVQNIANLKYNYAIKDIQQRQSILEGNSIQMVQTIDVIYNKMKYFDVVEEAYLDNADKIVKSLWLLSDEILFKYASGFVNELPDNMSQMVGYPAWWLEAVGYPNGPPPPPTVPKCCNPYKSGENTNDANDVVKMATPIEGVELMTGKAAMKQYLRVSTA